MLSNERAWSFASGDDLLKLENQGHSPQAYALFTEKSLKWLSENFSEVLSPWSAFSHASGDLMKLFGSERHSAQAPPPPSAEVPEMVIPINFCNPICLGRVCLILAFFSAVRSTKCKARAKVSLYKNEVFDLTFRPNCKNDLYSGGREGIIKHIDIRNAGEYNQCYKQPDKTAIVRIAFNELNDNQLAFSTSESPFVSLLDLRWPAQPHAFFQTPSRVNALQWSPRGSLLPGYITSGSNDGSVCIWDTNALSEPTIKEYPALNCRMGKGIWNFLWFPTDPSYLGVATDSGFQILQI